MKILNLDNWCKEAEDILKECLCGRETSEILMQGDRHHGKVWGRVGLITTIGKYVDLTRFDDLQFIASCTTGLDHIDLDYCKVKGIKVISLQGDPMLQDVYATAEHTWALILSLIRKVPFAFDDVKQGNWEREKWQGTELRGKALGIIGYGRVGQQVAMIAKAFGMILRIYDPLIEFSLDSVREEIYHSKVEHVLKHSDIITIHVPLTEETCSMFGIKQFKQMKPTAYFINTSRGVVVDEVALQIALERKYIAGAAIDVMRREPKLTGILYNWLQAETDNLIITPHIGGNTAESREKTQVFIASKIKEYIQNEM